jgi:hypothetical protein
MDLIFKEGLACEEYGKALAHVCFSDEKLSKKIASDLLTRVAKNQDEDLVKNILDVVIEFTSQDAERLDPVK